MANIQPKVETIKEFVDSLRRNDTKCVICHEKFEDGDTPEHSVVLPCDHVVGALCLEDWLSNKDSQGKCPLCRRILFRMVLIPESSQIEALQKRVRLLEEEMPQVRRYLRTLLLVWLVISLLLNYVLYTALLRPLLAEHSLRYQSSASPWSIVVATIGMTTGLVHAGFTGFVYSQIR